MTGMCTVASEERQRAESVANSGMALGCQCAIGEPCGYHPKPVRDADLVRWRWCQEHDRYEVFKDDQMLDTLAGSVARNEVGRLTVWKKRHDLRLRNQFAAEDVRHFDGCQNGAE